MRKYGREPFNIRRGIRSWLISVAITTVLVVAFSLMRHGMYLPGVPKPEEVQQVTVVCPRLTEEAKEYTDSENIGLAVHLTGFLKYALFEEADVTEPPDIEITYQLSSGESVTAAANESTVWWKGKAYPIRQKEMFVKLAEGIYFFEEAAEAAVE